MSSFTAIGVLFALGIATTYNGYFIDRVIWERLSPILTGAVGGRSISVEHRRLLFYRSWLFPAVAAFGYQSCVVIAWWLTATALATTGVADAVKLFAYLCLFYGVIGATFFGYQAVFGYFQLASVLREAEAD